MPIRHSGAIALFGAANLRCRWVSPWSLSSHLSALAKSWCDNTTFKAMLAQTSPSPNGVTTTSNPYAGIPVALYSSTIPRLRSTTGDARQPRRTLTIRWGASAHVSIARARALYHAWVALAICMLPVRNGAWSSFAMECCRAVADGWGKGALDDMNLTPACWKV